MNPRLKTGVAVGVALGVLALFFVFDNAAFSGSGLGSNSAAAANNSSQLISQDEVVGTGAAAALGDTLTVNYTGKLEDGTVFDTSVGKSPIQFVLGAGQVIPGWDQGLAGMKVGGKRLLVIPPDLGYGGQANGPIPANSTLIFEVDLLADTPGSGVQQ